MKIKIRLLFISLLLCVTFLNAQDNDAYREDYETWYRNRPDLGGDIKLLVRITRISANKAFTEFKLVANEDGEYYLNLWITCARHIDGATDIHDVYVNDFFYGTVTTPTTQWQGVALSNKVYLNEGENMVSVVNKDLIIPMVDFVRLSKDEERAKIPPPDDTSNDFLINKITIFPNPVLINSSLNITSDEIIGEIAIYDLSGRLMCTKNIYNTVVNLSVSDLNIKNSGLYVIKSLSKNNFKSQKIIVIQ